MKKALTLLVPTLLFSLSACNVPQTPTDTFDTTPMFYITEGIQPFSQDENNSLHVHSFFALIEIEHSADRNLRIPLDYYSCLNARVLHLYNDIDFNINKVSMDIKFPSFYGEKSIFNLPEDDEIAEAYERFTNTYIDYYDQYTTFLVYFGCSYLSTLSYTDLNDDVHEYEGKIITPEKFYLLPVVDDKLIVISHVKAMETLYSGAFYINMEYEGNAFYPHSDVFRGDALAYDILFKDGDDVYEDFPRRLADYNENYELYFNNPKLLLDFINENHQSWL